MSQCDKQSVFTDAEEIPSQPPLLDYGCTPWILSSQRVADQYALGVNMWSRTDLQNIESQLERSATLDLFTVRGVDGRLFRSKNPLLGVQSQSGNQSYPSKSIGKLVIGEFDGPSGAHYCSYLVQWRNQVAGEFRGNIEDWEKLFEVKSQLWNASISCNSFKQRLEEALAIKGAKVTKIICFGLGDIARQLPEVSVTTNRQKETESQGAEIHQPMMQHAAALTLAEAVRRYSSGSVRLFAQDPQYSDDTQKYLKAKGFEIVGTFGAGGFTLVDDGCIVFSAWPAAPVKQIVADLARPVGFITLSDKAYPFNRFNKPYFDAESPRTRQMWLDYKIYDFPTSPVEAEMMKGLEGLKIFVKD